MDFMGKVIVIIGLWCFGVTTSIAQNEKALVGKGNELYKQQQYQKAEEEYRKALAKDEKNAKANYNLGNTLYKSKKVEESAEFFDNAAKHAETADFKSRAFYNKGVSFSRQSKLMESIDAYKQSLRLNPADEEARQNLQKALNELKKQPPQPKQNNQNKDKKNKDDNPQQQKNNSKLNKKQVEQMLNALRQDEKQIQQNLQKRNNSMGSNGKDW